MEAIFITGTDTDSGKTIVSTWIAIHFSGIYWKPIQSGIESYRSDQDTVRDLSNSQLKIIPSNYLLQKPLSPHIAAKIDGKEINITEMKIPASDQMIIIEGAGGIMTPINDRHVMLDLAKQFSIPIIIVTRNVLGAINHTCMTVEMIKKHNLEILGIITIGKDHYFNENSIEHFTNVRIIEQLPIFQEICYNSLYSFKPSGIIRSILC